MLVREAMGGPVDTCGMDVTVTQVAKRMSDEGPWGDARRRAGVSDRNHHRT